MSTQYADTPEAAFKRITDSIVNWRDSTIEIAAVIVEAKEREIWKVKYETWSDYCQLECGLTRSWANRMIAAQETMRQIAVFENPKSLENKGTDGTERAVMPISNAKELGKIDPQQAAAILVDLQKKTPGKKPTQAAIAAAIAEIRAAEPEVVKLDKEGYPIPFKIQETWNRAEATAAAAIQVVVKLRAVLNDSMKENDIIYREFRFQENIGLLTTLFNNFKNLVPHAVCTSCQGKLPERCEECKGRGFVSAFAYQMFSNVEVKLMRSKLKPK